MEWITITIDGRNIQVPAEISILEACRTNKIQIPTLCHDPELTDSGACRLCMVEVEGARGLVASCSTKVQKGMVIRTNTTEIREARRTILELIIANHDIDCLTCQKMGNCELAQYAYEYGVKKDIFEGEKREYDIDDSNPFILRDLNKCILCGKCVRACSEVQVNNVLSYANRGFESRVGPAFNLPYSESECVFCGTCLAVCPVGALTEKKMVAKGRPWEIKKVRTTCPFCGTGCSFDLNVRDGKVIGVTTDASAPVNGRFLCVKGRFGIDLVHSPERLTTPLIRKNGELVEAEWYEALELIASKFKGIKNKYGADSLGALSSARCTNEENYVMQKFMRVVIGTNNVDHCARVCHAPSVAGLATSFGSGAMTNAIKEIPTSKVIFAIGTNATEAHPIIGTKIKQAVRNGCRLIVVDPRKIELVDHAELWLRLKPGTDIALINGIMHIILANEWEDKEFIKERTVGFDNLRELLRDYTPDYVSKITGVTEEQLYKAAEIYACAERAQIFYTLGITEHTHGTDNVMSLANLAMLTGNVGKENSGVNPLRGQNNVQGGCDMGALPNVYPGYQQVTDPSVQRKFERAWGVSLSSQKGYMIPDMFEASLAGQLKAMYIMGEDPATTDADSTHVRNGLKALDFLVVQDIFLTETAKLADVVLPGASFAEKTGTFTNTERRVQMVNKAIEPIGNAKEDWKIICDLASRMGHDFGYKSTAEIMNEVASLTPQYVGIRHDRLGRKGMQWPVFGDDHYGTQYLHKDKFTRGKGLFMPIEASFSKELPDEEYPLLLSTGRKLQHYNISTLYSESLLEHAPEEFAEVNPTDAEKLQIKDGELVSVASRRGEIKSRITVTDRVPPGMVFMTFHYKDAPANFVTIGACDKVSGTYEYKVCAIKIEKIKD